MELMEAIAKRKSIRKYTTDPVDNRLLHKVLEAARLAPSWKNGQCWRLVVVRDPARRQQLAEALPETNPCRKAFADAPVVIALLADPSESEVYEGRVYYMLDAGLAMEHLMLAACEEGLGTCWVGLFREEVVRKTLNLPDHIKVVALTPLGYPAKEPSPRPRKAMEEIVFSEIWGQKPEELL